MLGFRIPLAGFRIPKPWIPDSTDQNYLDSGFRITLHGAIQEMDNKQLNESLSQFYTEGSSKKDEEYSKSSPISFFSELTCETVQ